MEAEGVRKPGSVRVPVRQRPYWRPLRTLALGVAAVTAAGSLVTGAGWLLSQAGGGAGDSSQSTADSGKDASAVDGGAKVDEGVPEAGSLHAMSSPGYLACSRLVVEGTVTAVTPEPGTGLDLITLRVTHYYKPVTGPAEVTYLMDRDARPRPVVGGPMMIAIREGAEAPALWDTDEKQIAAERAAITAALPKSRTLQCD